MNKTLLSHVYSVFRQEALLVLKLKCFECRFTYVNL
jgi:hypothetical protein